MPTRRADARARARGALLGQLIGDALGTTVEFLDEATIAARHPGGLREIVGGGPFRLHPGQVTDDSELALALARSIVAEGGYREDAVAAAYVDWDRSRPFDIGRTIAAAFGIEPEPAKRLAERMRARASTTSQANGSLMRASPLGIFGAGLEPTRLAVLAATDSSLSHPHPVPRDACVAYCHALSTAIRDRVGARETYERTLAFAWSADLTDEVRNTLLEAPNRAPADYQTHMGWALIAFGNAFYQSLSAPTFEDGLAATVMHGGDADTNGCIAGALLGAIHGEEAIPSRWIDTVLSCSTHRGSTYQTTDARALADRLLELGKA